MKRKINVFLTEKQHKKLKNEGERLGSSMGAIVRRALDEYFKRASNE